MSARKPFLDAPKKQRWDPSLDAMPTGGADAAFDQRREGDLNTNGGDTRQRSRDQETSRSKVNSAEAMPREPMLQWVHPG